MTRRFGCDDCAHTAELFDTSVALTHDRICLRDDRVRLGIVQLYEQVAGANPLAFDNADRQHASGGLGGHLDACHNPYSPAGDHVLF